MESDEHRRQPSYWSTDSSDATGLLKVTANGQFFVFIYLNKIILIKLLFIVIISLPTKYTSEKY